MEQLRSRGLSPIAAQEGAAAAARVGAAGYFETSALTQSGLKMAFDAVIQGGLRKKFAERRGHGSGGKKRWSLTRVLRRIAGAA